MKKIKLGSKAFLSSFEFEFCSWFVQFSDLEDSRMSCIDLGNMVEMQKLHFHWFKTCCVWVDQANGEIFDFFHFARKP